MIPSDNTGKVLTGRLRIPGGTKLAINYSPQDAAKLREFAQSIKIKGDRSPSLALIARRALALYMGGMVGARTSDPQAFAAEIRALEKMVTPDPTGTSRGSRLQ